MNVKVLFFASLREAIGVESLAVSLAEGTFYELRVVLVDMLGELSDALWADNVRIARNQELLGMQLIESLVLADGDELAFLPPVTGG